MSPRTRSRWLVALLLLAVILVHAPWHGASFHFDDGHSIVRNPHIRDLRNGWRFFVDPTTFSERPEYAMYRPVVVLVNALNYAWGGLDPLRYQLVSVAVHTLATAAAYALLRALHLPSLAALLGAAFFGLHPLQTEATHYISSRSESLAGLLALTAVATYLRALESSAAAGWRVLSWSAYAVSLLCKPTALVVPLLLPLVERHAGSVRPRAGSSSARNLIPYALLSLAYVFLYHWLAGAGIQRAAAVRPLVYQLATQIKALIYYLLAVCIPIQQNVYRQFQVSTSLLQPVVLLALLLLASGLAFVVRTYRKNPTAGTAFGWFLICLLPTAVIPLHILVNDHRPYLALFGAALVVAEWARNKHGRPAVLALCVLLAGLTVVRGSTWRTEVTLWADAARKSPMMPDVQYNLGHAYHEEGDLQAARRAYARALAVDPQHALALGGLGTVLRQEGRTDAAIQRLEQAIGQDPDLVEAWNNLGLARQDQGNVAGAKRAFLRALELRPDLAEVHYNLGLLYRNQHDTARAVQQLRRALELDPGISRRFPARGP